MEERYTFFMNNAHEPACMKVVVVGRAYEFSALRILNVARELSGFYLEFDSVFVWIRAASQDKRPISPVICAKYRAAGKSSWQVPWFFRDSFRPVGDDREVRLLAVLDHGCRGNYVRIFAIDCTALSVVDDPYKGILHIGTPFNFLFSFAKILFRRSATLCFRMPTAWPAAASGSSM